MYIKFLDLGYQPIANELKKKNKSTFYRLKVFFNKKNFLVNISSNIKKKKCLIANIPIDPLYQRL